MSRADEVAEPEQMQLWRQIIARRSRLVEWAREWRAFGERQRAGHTPLSEYPADRVDAVASARESGARYVDGVVAVLLSRIEEIDQAIRAGSKESSTAGRGLLMPALRGLAATDDFGEGARAEALHYVLLYLRNRGDDLSRRTAEAVLCAYTKKAELDVSDLEKAARERRKQTDGTGALEVMAKWIVEEAENARADERT